jgi:hypothetical protein
LGFIKRAVLVAFDEFQAVLLGQSHIFLVHEDVFWGYLDLVPLPITRYVFCIRLGSTMCDPCDTL